MDLQNGMSSIKYNCQQNKTQSNEATLLMRQRLSNSYTRKFSYCGRSGVEPHVRDGFFKNIDLNFKGFENSAISLNSIKRNFIGSLPLNLQSSLLRDTLNIAEFTSFVGNGASNLPFLINSIDF